ncbi:MAG: hypothetical protein Q3M30_03950 [Candidatus Electrothrix sp. Rat3]|nr:hypothetical protein [Candidatus Electrothrix rattekaaiensis]
MNIRFCFYAVNFLFLVIFVENANASYIDPGTGSYIIQLIIAGFFGGLFILKLGWQKVKIFFSRKKQNVDNDNDEADQ